MSDGILPEWCRISKQDWNWRWKKNNAKIQAALLKAAELFAKKGYYGFSFDQLADQTGVAKRTLYKEANKEQLFLRIIEVTQQACEQLIFSHVATKQSTLDKIDQFTQHIEKLFITYPHFVQVSFLGAQSNAEEVLVEAVVKFHQCWVRAITQLINPLIKNKSLATQMAQQSLIYFIGQLALLRFNSNNQRKVIKQLCLELNCYWKQESNPFFQRKIKS